MPFSYVESLYCPKCQKKYDALQVHQLCICGSPLLVSYDLQAVKDHVTKEEIEKRPPTLWRYHEILPIQDECNVVSLGEGMTPLIEMQKLGSRLGVEKLHMKDEGLVPTGSFKARGAAVGVSKAKELGVKELAMPTNGNAGAAWALYATRASIKSHIVMPVDAPLITRKECAIAGANLYLVDGLISDAGKIIGQLVNEAGIYDASTLKEPYRIEGKKTMGYEIAEQLGWKLPDVILYPTGGGVGLIGIYKAICEMQELGWVEGKMPKLVAVQAAGCAPIVKAWETGEKESAFWEKSTTKAFGINVPKAIGDFLVLDALYESEGCAVAVTDAEITKEQSLIAELEGAFVCPEGAATFAAVRQLKASGWLKGKEHVVCLNTGQGIKYPESVEEHVEVLQPSERISFIR